MWRASVSSGAPLPVASISGNVLHEHHECSWTALCCIFSSGCVPSRARGAVIGTFCSDSFEGLPPILREQYLSAVLRVLTTQPSFGSAILASYVATTLI